MGALKYPKRPGSGPQAGSVRKVLRQGRWHICGFCRSRYDDPQDAKDCLETCFAQFLAEDPVIERKRLTLTVYRCRFCARDYGSEAAARRCAEECVAVLKEKHEAELRLAEEDGDPPPRRKPKPKVILAPAPVVVPKPKPKEPPKPSKPQPEVKPVEADSLPLDQDEPFNGDSGGEGDDTVP